MSLKTFQRVMFVLNVSLTAALLAVLWPFALWQLVAFAAITALQHGMAYTEGRYVERAAK